MAPHRLLEGTYVGVEVAQAVHLPGAADARRSHVAASTCCATWPARRSRSAEGFTAKGSRIAGDSLVVFGKDDAVELSLAMPARPEHGRPPRRGEGRTPRRRRGRRRSHLPARRSRPAGRGPRGPARLGRDPGARHAGDHAPRTLRVRGGRAHARGGRHRPVPGDATSRSRARRRSAVGVPRRARSGGEPAQLARRSPGRSCVTHSGSSITMPSTARPATAKLIAMRWSS